MKRPFLAVIDPAVQVPEVECFNRIATASPLPATYSLPALVGVETLPTDEPSGIVILGSASSVNDGLEWQMRLSDWLRPRMEKGIPTLGLCFGHQLVAQLFGGKVEYRFADQRKALGFETVNLAEDRLWGHSRAGTLFVSHREIVTRAPARMRVIATRPELPFDGFAHETLPIWTFQAHPEATPAFLRNREISVPPDGDPFAFGHGLVRAFLGLVANSKN